MWSHYLQIVPERAAPNSCSLCSCTHCCTWQTSELKTAFQDCWQTWDSTGSWCQDTARSSCSLREDEVGVKGDPLAGRLYLTIPRQAGGGRQVQTKGQTIKQHHTHEAILRPVSQSTCWSPNQQGPVRDKGAAVSELKTIPLPQNSDRE